MNETIKKLNSELKAKHSDVVLTEMRLQNAWDGVFKSMPTITDMVSELEKSSEYCCGKYGDINSWIRVDLSQFQECKEYFVNFMRDYHCVEVDFINDAIYVSHGDDCLIIQDDTRLDNGVWQSGQLVIDESEYENDDGDIDEVKRNKLIEAHMEKTGLFPGVFRVSSYGDVFPINTLK